MSKPTKGLSISAKITCIFVCSTSAACSFKIDVTSQRTALENQMLGEYKDIEDEMILLFSVRGPGKHMLLVRRTPEKARENQKFNQDDITELKDQGILGESNQGKIILVPPDVGAGQKIDVARLKLAKLLIAEENADRLALWQDQIAKSPSLKESDLEKVRKEFAESRVLSAQEGHWIQDSSGKWYQKKLVKEGEEPEGNSQKREGQQQ